MSIHNRHALVEYLCRVQHRKYEEVAPVHGWETHRESQGDWDLVPPENKLTMMDSMNAVLDELDDLGMIRLPIEVKVTRSNP